MWSIDKAPDPNWMPFLKMVFGILCLLIIATLTAIIALGKVEEKTSYGLTNVIVVIGMLSNGFVQWAFSSNANTPKEPN